MQYNFQILDCTLRDGGYYTNWDFNKSLVNAYIKAMNNLPIDYLEIGYRNPVDTSYMGKYGYCPIYELADIRKRSRKKLAIMINEKSVNLEDLEKLIVPIRGLVDMVRIAVNPQRLEPAIILAKQIKKLGFEVGFNTMYMSTWKDIDSFYDKLDKLDEVVTVFNMVDSYGSVTPTDVVESMKELKKHLKCKIGFHGHNNLQLGLINTVTAIKNEIDSVDATILGMGRGAGNLNMELLLTFMNKFGLEVNFNELGDIISEFESLYKKYCWGTNLPYMLSGANSFPQKEVMAWVNNRTYSFNSIVRALDNRRNHQKDNAHYPLIKVPCKDNVLIVGGGNSVQEHIDGIRQYLKNNPSMPVIFVTARYADLFNDIDNSKFYCLVGNEAKRMIKNLPPEKYNGMCVLAPYPRAMGTEVPTYAESTTKELSAIAFTKEYPDSCTTIALQLSLDMDAKNVMVVGYDGYCGEVLSEKESDLMNENRSLFSAFLSYKDVNLIALTPTIYKELKSDSLYQIISNL